MIVHYDVFISGPGTFLWHELICLSSLHRVGLPEI